MEALSNWLSQNGELVFGWLVANFSAIMLAILTMLLRMIVSKIQTEKAQKADNEAYQNFLTEIEEKLAKFQEINQELVTRANAERNAKNEQMLKELKALNEGLTEVEPLEDTTESITSLIDSLD